MADLTVSADIDTFMASANNAAARTNLGLTALATTTPGTGVATALAVNIGSAGAPILFNGAAGTPSSLVGTNITGTAAGLTAGTASAVAVGGITGLGGGVSTLLTATLTDPGADRILFWDDSAGTFTYLSIGSGLDLTDTTLTATGSGTGDVTAAANFGTTDRIIRSDGTLKGVQASGITIDDSDNVTGVAAITTDEVNASVLAFNGTLGTDDTYSGEVKTGFNSGYTNSQWDVVYFDGTAGEWLAADANGTGTFPAEGIAVTSGTDGNPLTVLFKGFVRNDAWAWTPGGAIYLDTTAGGLTQTAPSTSGDKVQRVGKAYTADKAWFDFNDTYLTVA